MYDLIIVGGGTSGMMAAIHAGMQGANILVIDRNPRFGRKLVLTGGGRCNVTNNTSIEGLIDHIPGNGRFLYSALHAFGPQDIIQFFEQLGTELKEEDHGRMFPVTNRARTILETLDQAMDQYNIEKKTKSVVDGLLFNEEHTQVTGVVLEDGSKFYAKAVLLACGGEAYPRTGTKGDGYAFAKSAGHTITDLYATEVPVLSKDPWVVDKSMQGLSLRDVSVSVWGDQPNPTSKPIFKQTMDMVFTHFGYSGPVVLRASGHINQYLKESGKKRCHLSIDLMPDVADEEWQSTTENLREKSIRNVLKEWMPERMADLICRKGKFDALQPFKQLNHSEAEDLYRLCRHFPLTAYGTQEIALGFVTGGGVNLKEINPSTMASKLVDGLYFSGELLDINGYTGGYNITVAFSTGAMAGTHAAWYAMG